MLYPAAWRINPALRPSLYPTCHFLIPFTLRFKIQTNCNYWRKIYSTSEAIGPWKYKDGLLFFKQRVYLLHNSPLVPSIILTVHNSNHEGYHKTLHRIAQDFYWQGMKTFIRAFMRQSLICQKHKAEKLTSSRSSSTFANSTSDLVEYLYGFHWMSAYLPRKSVLLVMVDHFSMHAHLLPIANPYTVVRVAHLFFDLNFFDVTFTSFFGLNCFGWVAINWLSALLIIYKVICKQRLSIALSTCICIALQVTVLTIGFNGYLGCSIVTTQATTPLLKLLHSKWYMADLLPLCCLIILD